MSNTIDFLESMGQDASLRHADPELLRAIVHEAIDDARVRVAILGADRSSLEFLTGSVPNVFCGLAPSKKEDEDEDEEEPSREDEVTRFFPTLQIA